MNSGNQPPCATLMMLAAKNAKSSSSNVPITTATTTGCHRHSNAATNDTRMVSIIIVPVTAMP